MLSNRNTVNIKGYFVALLLFYSIVLDTILKDLFSNEFYENMIVVLLYIGHINNKTSLSNAFLKY